MGSRAAYWFIVASPLALVALLSAWPAFRRGYWRGAGAWGPGLLAAGALLAFDGVMSSAIGFWRFTDERFAPERYLHLPAAEWLFFVAAMAGVRLLWYVAEDALPRAADWLADPLRHARTVALAWSVPAAAGAAFGLAHHDRARTVYVLAMGVPLALFLAMRTRPFWTRATQAYLGLGFALFLPMDMLMNGMGSFDHAGQYHSGFTLAYGVPVEDLGYMFIVLVMLRFLQLPVVGGTVDRPG